MKVKYLISNRPEKRILEKGTYLKSDLVQDHFEFQLLSPKRIANESRKDIVIDLPPRKEKLKSNAAVLIPVEFSRDRYKEDKCGSNRDNMYLDGTLLGSKDSGMVTIKSVYTRKHTSSASF